MTKNEAIKELKAQIAIAESMISYNRDFEQKHDNSVLENKIKVAEMAISALEEIQQYRAIGTVEECQKARERQRAKKYKTINMISHCTECDCQLKAWYVFCPECGQAIGWHE